MVLSDSAISLNLSEFGSGLGMAGCSRIDVLPSIAGEVGMSQFVTPKSFIKLLQSNPLEKPKKSLASLDMQTP